LSCTETKPSASGWGKVNLHGPAQLFDDPIVVEGTGVVGGVLVVVGRVVLVVRSGVVVVVEGLGEVVFPGVDGGIRVALNCAT
jgi:hypothetical protein